MAKKNKEAKRGLRKLKLSNETIIASGILCPRCNDRLTSLLLCPSCGIRYRMPRRVKGKYVHALAYTLYYANVASESERETARDQYDRAEKLHELSSRYLATIGAAFLEWQTTHRKLVSETAFNVGMWKLLNELVETPNANLLDFATNMRALLDGVDITAFNRD